MYKIRIKELDELMNKMNNKKVSEMNNNTTSDSTDNSKRFTSTQIAAMRAVCDIPVLSWSNICKNEEFLDALDYLSQAGIIQEFVVNSNIGDKFGSIYCFTNQTKEIINFIDFGPSVS